MTTPWEQLPPLSAPKTQKLRPTPKLDYLETTFLQAPKPFTAHCRPVCGHGVPPPRPRSLGCLSLQLQPAACRLFRAIRSQACSVSAASVFSVHLNCVLGRHCHGSTVALGWLCQAPCVWDRRESIQRLPESVSGLSLIFFFFFSDCVIECGFFINPHELFLVPFPYTEGPRGRTEA